MERRVQNSICKCFFYSLRFSQSAHRCARRAGLLNNRALKKKPFRNLGWKMSVDWESKYKKLKQKVDVVVAQLLYESQTAPEDDGDSSVTAPVACEDDYHDRIAPTTLNLPVIMTHCTPAERAKLFEKATRYISADGKWNGSDKKKNGRGRMRFLSEYARQLTLEGKRAPAKIKGTDRTRPLGITIYATNIILVGNGFYPTEERNVASHICNSHACLDVSHLRWESPNDNTRRERMCGKMGTGTECRCGLDPPCNFALH